MAQRSPIRSFLSVVPSNEGEPPKQLRKPKASAKRGAKPASGKSTTLPAGESRRSRQRRKPNPRGQTSPDRSLQAVERLRSPQVDLPGNPLTSGNGTQSGSPQQPPRRPNSIDLLAQQYQSSKRQPVALSRQPPSVSSAIPPRGTPQPLGESASSPVTRQPVGPKRTSHRPSAKGAKNQPASSSNPSGRAKSPSTQATKRQKKKTAKQRQSSVSPLVYGARLLILGVGLGVIVGTFLSVWDPASKFSAGASGTATEREEQQENVSSPAQSVGIPAVQRLTQEMTPLKNQLQEMAAAHSELSPGVFVVDLDSGAFLDMNGTASVSAASTIKVPILIAFFQDVDAGKIRLDESLRMKQEHIAQGSGDMQYSEPGTQWTALETITKMITISDNTATNMAIERLGGAEALNQRFKSWGLTSTAIANPLPDLEGTNTTSPRDLVNLMGMVEHGKLVSLRSRDRLFAIMRATVNNSLLPQGLGQGAIIAHKTGDIGSTIADAGLVDISTGKRYLIAMFVKRPHNDPAAEELIREMSQAVYNSFNGEPVSRDADVEG